MARTIIVDDDESEVEMVVGMMERKASFARQSRRRHLQSIAQTHNSNEPPLLLVIFTLDQPLACSCSRY